MTIARKTKFAAPGFREYGQLTNTVIDDGEMVAIDAAGYARPARAISAATGDRVVGIAHIQGSVTKSDSTGVASGLKTIKVRDDDIAMMNNSLSGELIANVDVGALCYVADSVTVQKTDGGAGARTAAGLVYWVDSATGFVGVKFVK